MKTLKRYSKGGTTKQEPPIINGRPLSQQTEEYYPASQGGKAYDKVELDLQAREQKKLGWSHRPSDILGESGRERAGYMGKNTPMLSLRTENSTQQSGNSQMPNIPMPTYVPPPKPYMSVQMQTMNNNGTVANTQPTRNFYNQQSNGRPGRVEFKPVEQDTIVHYKRDTDLVGGSIWNPFSSNEGAIIAEGYDKNIHTGETIYPENATKTERANIDSYIKKREDMDKNPHKYTKEELEDGKVTDTDTTYIPKGSKPKVSNIGRESNRKVFGIFEEGTQELKPMKNCLKRYSKGTKGTEQTELPKFQFGGTAGGGGGMMDVSGIAGGLGGVTSSLIGAGIGGADLNDEETKTAISGAAMQGLAGGSDALIASQGGTKGVFKDPAGALAAGKNQAAETPYAGQPVAPAAPAGQVTPPANTTTTQQPAPPVANPAMPQVPAVQGNPQGAITPASLSPPSAVNAPIQPQTVQGVPMNKPTMPNPGVPQFEQGGEVGKTDSRIGTPHRKTGIEIDPTFAMPQQEGYRGTHPSLAKYAPSYGSSLDTYNTNIPSTGVASKGSSLTQDETAKVVPPVSTELPKTGDVPLDKDLGAYTSKGGDAQSSAQGNSSFAYNGGNFTNVGSSTGGTSGGDAGFWNMATEHNRGMFDFLKHYVTNRNQGEVSTGTVNGKTIEPPTVETPKVATPEVPKQTPKVDEPEVVDNSKEEDKEYVESTSYSPNMSEEDFRDFTTRNLMNTQAYSGKAKAAQADLSSLVKYSGDNVRATKAAIDRGAIDQARTLSEYSHENDQRQIESRYGASAAEQAKLSAQHRYSAGTQSLRKYSKGTSGLQKFAPGGIVPPGGEVDANGNPIVKGADAGGVGAAAQGGSGSSTSGSYSPGTTSEVIKPLDDGGAHTGGNSQIPLYNIPPTLDNLYTNGSGSNADYMKHVKPFADSQGLEWKPDPSVPNQGGRWVKKQVLTTPPVVLPGATSPGGDAMAQAQRSDSFAGNAGNFTNVSPNITINPPGYPQGGGTSAGGSGSAVRTPGVSQAGEQNAGLVPGVGGLYSLAPPTQEAANLKFNPLAAKDVNFNQDTSQYARNELGRRMGAQQARDLSGGSASGLLSNLSMGNATTNEANSQYQLGQSERQQQVANANTANRQQVAQYNNQGGNQVNQANEVERAATENLNNVNQYKVRDANVKALQMDLGRAGQRFDLARRDAEAKKEAKRVNAINDRENQLNYIDRQKALGTDAGDIENRLKRSYTDADFRGNDRGNIYHAIHGNPLSTQVNPMGIREVDTEKKKSDMLRNLPQQRKGTQSLSKYKRK